jgi:hypothetical protein
MTWILKKRSLAAAAVMAATALFSGALPASAATGPDGFTILHADAGNIAHQCRMLGTGYDARGDFTDADVCVDIDTSGGESGYRATGAVEAYCETYEDGTTFDAPCPKITIDGVFANGSTGAAKATWSCDDNCSSDARNILYTESINYTSANCEGNPVNDVWSEAAGGTSITLFTSVGSFVTYTVAADGANDGTADSTGHYWICP